MCSAVATRRRAKVTPDTTFVANLRHASSHHSTIKIDSSMKQISVDLECEFKVVPFTEMKKRVYSIRERKREQSEIFILLKKLNILCTRL